MRAGYYSQLVDFHIMMWRASSRGVTVNTRLFRHVPFLPNIHQDETTYQFQLQSREGTVYVHVSIQIYSPSPAGWEHRDSDLTDNLPLVMIGRIIDPIVLLNCVLRLINFLLIGPYSEELVLAPTCMKLSWAAFFLSLLPLLVCPTFCVCVLNIKLHVITWKMGMSLDGQSLEHKCWYHNIIAGNFRGRKLSRIRCLGATHEKFLPLKFPTIR